MKTKNKLVIEDNNKKDEFSILLKVEANDKEYIIYTKNEFNDCGDVIAYAASYEFKNGKQTIKPVEEEQTLEFLDSILLQIQNKMNKGTEVEINEKE